MSYFPHNLYWRFFVISLYVVTNLNCIYLHRKITYRIHEETNLKQPSAPPIRPRKNKSNLFPYRPHKHTPPFSTFRKQLFVPASLYTLDSPRTHSRGSVGCSTSLWHRLLQIRQGRWCTVWPTCAYCIGLPVLDPVLRHKVVRSTTNPRENIIAKFVRGGKGGTTRTSFQNCEQKNLI